MSELQLRATMCEIGRRLWQLGLIGGTEGNFTCRVSARQLLCTPSGLSKGHLKPDDLLIIDLNGNLVRGERPVSSEIKLHLAIYKARKDCEAVVHAHPPTATAFTIAEEDIPDNVLPEAAMVLGSVATVPFAFPGTDEVPDRLAPYMEDHKTFLLSHHGAAVMGKDLWDACYRMETLERVARMLFMARLMNGVRPMPDHAFDRLLHTALTGAL